MRLDHRILIGLTGAIGKMGPHSQIVTNRVAYSIGQEVGNELKDRGALNKNMSLEQIWNVLNKELAIDESAELETFGESGTSEMRIKIGACNICPKKVGKYTIPATACPVGGIFKGVSEAVGKADSQTKLDLVPGETCSVYISGYNG